MCALRNKISKRFSSSKSLLDTQIYKYNELKDNWIIYQGNLQYLYNTNILGDSLFRNYFVVLTRIPMENFEDKIELYLFTEEKKSPVHFLLIDHKTKITDHVNRNIKPIPKFFLMELISDDKDKPEVFGAKDNAERKIWIEHLKRVVSKIKIPRAASEPGYLIPQPIGVSNLELTRILSDSDSSPYSKVEPTDYSQSTIHSSSSSYVFNWNEIFYLNQNEDYKNILVKTGEYGAFLIRPQSKKTSASDHDYTLCVYHELNVVRCFPIFQLSKRRNEYSLSMKDPKSFIDMIELCEYYRINPLPSISTNFYLKKPYKTYENNFYYLE